MNEHKDILAAVSKRLRSDQYARFLGIQITQIERGSAQAELTVVEHMLNLNKLTHGGVIFSLADVAFAAACNSFNQTSVALSLHIIYRKPVKLGTKLIAEAKEESAGKNTALYKITVRTEEDHLVALCEGLAYKLESKIVDIDNDGPEAI
ncbi:MAG: PaaI family thioesterase [Halobacteriota archaeon]